MHLSTLGVLLVLAAHTPVALAQATATAQSSTEVLAAEDARFAAMLRADTTALARMLADDLVYVHSSGRVETKAQFLTAVGSRGIEYLTFVPMERRVTLVAHDVALVTARANARVAVAGQPTDYDVRYIAVYSRVDARWQLRGWQTTPITAPPGR